MTKSNPIVALSTATLDDLLIATPIISVKRGVAIQPGNLYRVCAGRVRLYRPLDDGKQVGFGFRGPDQFFGFAWSNEVAMAKCDSTVMGWTPGRITELVSKRPDLGLALLSAVIAESQRMTERIVSMNDDSEKRIARLLLDMASSAEVLDGVAVIAPVTHEEIAFEVLTTREVVTHYMNVFRSAKAINYDRRSIRVRPAVLDALAFPKAVVKEEAA